jgi:hypothetical protein
LPESWKSSWAWNASSRKISIPISWELFREKSKEKTIREKISTEEELQAFANRVKFPEHGLIVRKAKGEVGEMEKGIQDWPRLRSVFHEFREKRGSAFVETDMRAHLNPTRMRVIRTATQKLAEDPMYCQVCNP